LDGLTVQEDLLTRLPLVCVACRAATPLVIVTVVRRDQSDILEGVLGCTRCRRRYAIVDGIPILIRDTSPWLARNAPAAPPLSAEVMAVLVEPGPDDSHIAKFQELLSVYLDAHWGDRASPPVQHSGALYDRVAQRATARVEMALELGCNVGRGVFELARGADLTVGVDTSLEALRRARSLLAGETLSHARRISGRYYAPAPIRGERAAAKFELVCADVLDLPFSPARFGRVLSINMLEVVPDPLAYLGVLVELCAAGGELVCCSPYNWQSGFVDDKRRIGQYDPGAEVVRLLTWERGMTLESQADVDVVIRREARHASVFRVHWLQLRKRA
jgi:SAM-dependent methyltransferase/uncharacterized protein YbaR (Trm112 family)